MRVVIPDTVVTPRQVSAKKMPQLSFSYSHIADRWKKMVKFGVPPSKAKDYYEVSRIIRHRVDRENDKVSYLIRWEDYGPEDDSWIPETFMDGSIDLVNEYRAKIGLPPSELVKFAGSSNPDILERGNWVSPDLVLGRIVALSRHPRYCSDIIVKEFREGMALETSDTIYITVVNFHFYVVLYLPDAGHSYIADGDNSFLSKEEVRGDINNLFGGCSLRPLLFVDQEGSDMCGSSAVIIAVEYLRLYKTKEAVGDSLVIRRGLLNRIKKSFHRFKAVEKLTSRESNHLKRNHLKCSMCGWGTNSTKRQALLMHIRRVHSAERDV